ncbi:unnamed protein product [Closterium sp. Naga37s-1]|nr:unnamed protein product [Closterium sp. Naga37s-1]
MADHIPVSNVAPPDRFYLAYFIFLLLGVGFLLPWNAFITAVDYFYLLYPTAHVATLFCVAYMFANLGTLILVLLYGQHVPSRTRIVNGFIAFTLLVLLVPALDALSAPGAIPPNAVQDADSPAVATTPAMNPAASSPLALALTVAAVAASGAIDAVVQGSLFGMAGELHERYTQALAAGTSVSGIVVSVVRILTKAVLPNTPTGLRLSAHLYFLLSALILLVCLLAFRRLHSLPVIVFLQSQVAALAEAERRARDKARKEARRAGPGSGAVAAKAICHGGSGRSGGKVAGEGHAGEGRMGESVGVYSQAEEREVAAEGGLAGAGEDESLEPLVKRVATIEEEQVIRQLLQIEDESEWWEQERARDLTGIEGEGEEEGAGAGAAGAGAAVTVREAGAEAESVADGAPLMDGCSASCSEIAEIDWEWEGQQQHSRLATPPPCPVPTTLPPLPSPGPHTPLNPHPRPVFSAPLAPLRWVVSSSSCCCNSSTRSRSSATRLSAARSDLSAASRAATAAAASSSRDVSMACASSAALCHFSASPSSVRSWRGGFGRS